MSLAIYYHIADMTKRILDKTKKDAGIVVALALACYAIITEREHYRDTLERVADSNVSPICKAMTGRETTALQVDLIKNWVSKGQSPSKQGALSNACDQYRPALARCMTSAAIEQVCFLVR